MITNLRPHTPPQYPYRVCAITQVIMRVSSRFRLVIVSKVLVSNCSMHIQHLHTQADVNTRSKPHDAVVNATAQGAARKTDCSAALFIYWWMSQAGMTRKGAW